jgi:hypothetical protein
MIARVQAVLIVRLSAHALAFLIIGCGQVNQECLKFLKLNGKK